MSRVIPITFYRGLRLHFVRNTCAERTVVSLRLSASILNLDDVIVLDHRPPYSVKASCLTDAEVVSEDRLYFFEGKAGKLWITKDDDD